MEARESMAKAVLCMKKSKRIIHSIALTVVALAAISSCRKSVGVAVVSSPLPAEKAASAVITFLLGSVEVSRGGVNAPAQLGQELLVSDGISTGLDSLCEIRIGGLATVRLSENSIASLESLKIAGGKSSTQIGLAAGTLIQKVSKLSSSDAYVIRTPSAVCGVRGTTFAVSADAKTSTSLVAVEEGKVSVLPASASLDRLAERAGKNGAARSAYRSLLAVAPAVGPGQEYRSPEAGRADPVYEKLLEELEAIGYPDNRESDPLAGLIPAGEISSPEVQEARSVATIVAANLSLGAPRAPGLEGKALLSELKAVFKPERLPGGEEPTPEPTEEPLPSAPSAKPGPQLDPLINQYRPGEGSAIRGSLSSYNNDLVLAMDAAGTLRAFRAGETPAWTMATKLSSSQPINPVVYKAGIYLSDGKTLLGLEAATGIEFLRVGLEEPMPAGMSILQTASGILVPGAEASYLYDALSGALIRRDPVPSGLAVSPIMVSAPESGAARTNRLAVLFKNGTLEFRMLDTGRPSSSFPNTGIEYSRGRVMRELAGRLLVADSGGNMSLYDPSLPEAERLVWQYQFEPPSTDPAFWQTAIVYPTSKGIQVLEPSTADPLGIIKNASGPFLLSQGTLYAGTTDKKLVVASANPFKVLQTIPLPAELGANPLIVDGRLWLACRDGSSFWIEVKKLPAAK